MRKLGLLILVFWTYILAGQEVRVHHVRPGETFASIAAKYDVPESKLRSENILTPECHVGAVLNIPSREQALLDSGAADYLQTAYADLPYSPEMEALSLMKDGKLNKARKLLTRAIKVYPLPTSYYYRGLCNFRSGKWKPAINDLEAALGNKHFPAYLTADAESMLEVAKENREIQLEKRRDTWAAIGTAVGTAVLVAGAVAVDAYVYSETGTSAFATLAGYSDPSMSMTPVALPSMSSTEFNSYINNEMIRLMNMTVAQTNQQNQQEYMQFCMYNKDSDGNPLYTYDQWYAMKAAAFADTQMPAVSTYDDDDNSSDSFTGENEYVKKVRESNPYGNKDCPSCRGTGTCQTCNGSGWQDGGFGLERQPCANCYVENGLKTGRCSKCRGTGTVYGHKGI